MLTPEEQRQVEQVLLEFARLGQARATQPAALLARLPAGPEAIDHLVELARAEGLPWIGHLARTTAAAPARPATPVPAELEEEDAPLSFADAWGPRPSAAEKPARPSGTIPASKAPRRPGWFWGAAAGLGLGIPLLAFAVLSPVPAPVPVSPAAVSPAPSTALRAHAAPASSPRPGLPKTALRGPVGHVLDVSGTVVGIAADCPVVKSGGRYYMIVGGPAGEPRTGEKLAFRAKVAGRSADGMLYVEAMP